MDQELQRIHRQLLLIVVGSFALVPIFGYGIAIYIGMVSLSQLTVWPVGTGLLFVYFALLVWMIRHFRRVLLPVIAQGDNQTGSVDLPQKLAQKLQGHADSYWSFFLL